MNTNDYEDIINLERPISKKHMPMPIENRAAQFMPFAALTGYDDAVVETARYTSERKELTLEKKTELDEKIQTLMSENNTEKEVSITYFVADKYKAGGEYLTKKVIILKADMYKRCIVLKDKTEIPIDDIFSIDL